MGTYKSFRGDAGPLELAADPGASGPIITATGDVSGWPDGTDARAFVLEIDRGTDNAERVLCSLLTAGAPNSFQVLVRGWDGTANISHSPGVAVEHVLDGDTIDDLERHVYDPTRDDHGQYLNVPRHDTTARHTFGVSGALGVPGTPAPITDTASAGTGARPAREDHVHVLGDNSVPLSAIPDATLTGAKFALATLDDPLVFGADLSAVYISDTVHATPYDRMLQLLPTKNRLQRWNQVASKWVILSGGPALHWAQTADPSIAGGATGYLGSWALIEQTDSFTDVAVSGVSNFVVPAGLAGVYRIESGVRFAADADLSTWQLILNVNTVDTEALDERDGIAGHAFTIEGGDEVRFADGDSIRIGVHSFATGGTRALAHALQFHYFKMRYVRP